MKEEAVFYVKGEDINKFNEGEQIFANLEATEGSIKVVKKLSELTRFEKVTPANPISVSADDRYGHTVCDTTLMQVRLEV